MAKFSRIALALPLCVAVAAPASASQFFDFSVSFDGAAGAFEFKGQTAFGDAEFDTPYTLSSLRNVTFNGAPVLFYAGDFVNNSGVTGQRYGGDQRIKFTGANMFTFIGPTYVTNPDNPM